MRATAPRWLAAAALVLGLVGGLAGPAAAQGELRVAIPWTPENLDPTTLGWTPRPDQWLLFGQATVK